MGERSRWGSREGAAQARGGGAWGADGLPRVAPRRDSERGGPVSEHDWDLTRPIGPSRPLPPPPESSRRQAPTPRGRGLAATLGLTLVNAVLPGTAFLAAGRRRLGALVLVVFLLLVGGAAWLATAGQRTAAQVAVNATALVWVFGGLLALG